MLAAPQRHEITGLVLAGGRGQRMQDADKGLVPFRGRALVEHALKRLQPQVGRCLISANRNQAIYASLGVDVIGDELADFPGPLAGVLAGLNACQTQWLATVPCDVPCFPLTLVKRLLDSLRSTETDVSSVPDAQAPLQVCVVRTFEEVQAVFMLLPAGISELLRLYLFDGRRSVQGWLTWLETQNVRVRYVAFDEEARQFVNLNTLAELRQLEADPLD